MTFCTPSRKLALGAATLASCIASAAFAQCGDPAAGDCCAANGTPFCSDAECCNQICTADPFCCNTQWDTICANAANASCAVCVGGGCELATPDFLEPEECGTDVNGGCNSTPQAWTAITIGETVQGTFWADADTRDTDWYRFTVTEDTEVTATLRSALPSFVAFVDPVTCAIIGSTSTGSCPESTTFCFTPGEYYAVALTEGFAGFPCGNPLGNDYTLELTGVAGTCGGGGGSCGAPNGNDCCAANTTPGCSDAECCNQVCAADPFCCNTEWDLVCANAANASCAVCVGGGCELATPDFLEPEECGTDVNGGCNSTPQAWTAITIGETVQGTFWADADTRDTDWYRFTVTEDTEVTATLRSALPSFVAFVDPVTCAIIGSTSTGSCPESTTFCFTPGEYYAVALTEGFAGFPCGNPLGNDYTLELTGVASTCGGGGGGCEACDSPTVVTVGDNPFVNAATGCNFASTGCGQGSAFNANFFVFTPTESGSYSFSTCNQADFDSVLVVATGCAGAQLACNDDGAGCAGFTSFIADVDLTAGQSYIVAIGGYSATTASGSGTLTIALGGGGGGSCGKPNGNDCCAANTTPGCSDATCCEAICAVDPFCCESQWDQICADAAIAGCDPSACGGGGGGGVCGEPNGNDCCAANTTPGCSDAECCNQICAVDPFCCNSSWDQICADAAATGCASCAGVPGDLDGNGTVDSADLSILLNGWGTPAGDLNGDGTTDSADLSILLNNWGA
jgi:hypothetical protein